MAPPDSISFVTRPVEGARRLSPLGAFVDRLVQTFEDRRPGLTDADLRQGERACERFFTEVYEKEASRLRELIERQEHLPKDARDALFAEVDRLIRTVVIPAYVRLTSRFTPRERNDFYLVREGLHALERVGWGVAGVAAGALVVWAPFIPLWSKEWIVPFMVAGLFLPNLRAWMSYRRYERELNELVQRTDREAGRIDVAYLLRAHVSPVQALGEAAREADPQKTGVH